MDGLCRAAWAESQAAGAERKLLVINLEQRNHGTREVVCPAARICSWVGPVLIEVLLTPRLCRHRIRIRASSREMTLLVTRHTCPSRLAVNWTPGRWDR